MGGDWHFLDRASERRPCWIAAPFRPPRCGSAPYGRRSKVTHARAARGGVRAWAPRLPQMTVQIEPRLVQGQNTHAGYFSFASRDDYGGGCLYAATARWPPSRTFSHGPRRAVNLTPK